MPVSDLIFTRRRRGSLETIKQSEYNRKRGNSTAGGGDGEGKEEDEDNTGNNAKEFRRKSINTSSNFPNNDSSTSGSSSRKAILVNTKSLDDEEEVDVNMYKAACDDDDDENDELLFSSSLLCIDNSIIIDLAKQKIKGGERFYHNNKQKNRRQRQHEQEKQYDDDHWYNNDFAGFDEDDTDDDDDDDRSEEEKQQLRKFSSTSCCTRTRKTTMQRSENVKTNECSQLYNHQHYQHNNLQQNSKILLLEQLQQEHQIGDSQTIVLSHPRLVLNERCTSNNNTKSLVVLHNKNNISDKWRRIGRNNGSKKGGSQFSSNLRTSSEESGETPERSDVGTVKVVNFVTTSTMRPINFSNKNNRISSCTSRDVSGRVGSCKNEIRSSFCDNQLINKLSSSEVLLLFGERILRRVFPMMNRKSQRWRRKENNVFTLFNFISVLICLLLCFSNCHQVNCVEVHDRLNTRASSTDFDNLKQSGESKRDRYSGTGSVETGFGLFGINENSVESSSPAEITSQDDDPSSFSSFHEYIYRGHLLDKRSSGSSSDAPPRADVENKYESYLDVGGGNSNDSIMTLTEDRNKSNQFTATNGVSFSNVDGEGKKEGDDDSSRNIGDGVSNKDEIEPRESDDISSRAQQNNSNTLEERTAPSKSFLRVERNTKGKTNDDHKGISTGNTGGDASSVHTNEPSPFEKMSGDEPTKDHFYKNLSSSSSTPNKRGSRSVCRLSEFVCKGGKCISADKFCDGVDDCGDGSPSSDEPRFCTPCNRTYYGEVGSTYHISLSSETIAAALGLNHPQQVDSQSSNSGHGGPSQFVCHLTFFAAGDNFGDLVQLMFDSVNIGQFVSSVIEGCPEGSLQVAEISRPITGGQWCGSGAGFSVYFSEMSTITLTLIVGGPSLAHSTKSSPQNTTLTHVIRPIDAFPGSSRTGASPGAHQNTPVIPPPPPPEFDFKMRYKFIPSNLAAVRYGTHNSPIERGQLEPGTYCNRILEQCHRRRCKIQSPNYPGLYPRNVSCFFTVRQRDTTQCKRFLIQVSQSRSHKVQLRSLLPGPQISLASGLVMSPVAANDPTASMAIDTFMAWDECNWSRDRIVIYDGNSADAPVLLSICGGTHIPPVTSSGPEIHIAFYSTPFGNPLGPVPPPPFPAPLRGFELDVDVVLVDSESADYSNSPNCTFYFVSSKTAAKGHRAFKLQQDGGNWITGVTGHVSSPRHTLPPNTTCRYEFKGADNEAIWIYFVSYRRDSVKDSKRLPEGNCTTRLTIRDGLLGHGQNRALLGSFCDSELPKLCEHKALQNETRLVRACTANESYISAGASLIIEQQFLEGTALRPLHYKFHYEFVNRHPTGNEGACSRHFHMGKIKSKKGTIRTSDNIFDFGRGGRRNLTCTYTFTMGTHDGLRLTILRSSFGDRPCRTQTDLETGRYACNYYKPSPSIKTSTATGSSGLNDTLSALGNANMTMPTQHPFFAADHPSGNYTGSGARGESHHSKRPHIFPRSEFTLEEFIWPGVNITSHINCICSNSSGSSFFTWTFLGRKVLLTFTVENMKGQDGYENFFVDLEYEVLKGDGCRGDNHYMKTESGLISLESYFSYGPRDQPPTCDHYPWLLEAKENHSLYLRIPGFAMLEEPKRGNHHQPKLQGLTLHNLTTAMLQQANEDDSGGPLSKEQHLLPLPFTANSLMNTTAISSNKATTMTGSAIFQLDRICPTTKNRIFVYDRDNRLVQKICPSSNHQMSKKNVQVVELYSEEFYQYTSPLYPPPRPRFIIEFVGRELGTYRINWLEVMSARMKTTLKALQTDFVGRATIAGRGLGANYSDVYKKELQKITSSWDETLTAMFEGQNGIDQMPPPGGSGGDSVHLVDERPPSPPPVCSSYCPELRACISEKLWCDGEIHCPVTKMDEISCDSFWLTLGQLMSPAVYVPLLAAVVSALSCCVLVMLCVGVKKMILSSRFKRHHHHHHHHRPGSVDGRSSMGSSCTSTVDRRTLPPRDWTLDPHDPLS